MAAKEPPADVAARTPPADVAARTPPADVTFNQEPNPKSRAESPELTPKSKGEGFSDSKLETWNLRLRKARGASA